ncbi:Rieske (2Fe-2S) protein [Actinoplanes sp. CA-015351]|uniref:Rieske (2Fe-2S) protein n=1 Tax=Actinoplanes sp. CA-015351 TaxID=3239897 RepID=UPI003D9971F9
MTDVQTRTEATTHHECASASGATSTRRCILVGAGALGAGAVLAACGTDSSGTNPNGTDFDTNPAPAGSTAAGSTDGDTGDSGGSATVLVAASEVAVGGGVITSDLVVTQPTEGTFKAFSKVCTHQGCEVSEIADGQIICRCHNSFFSIKDGAPTSGPAQQPLTETKVELDGDNVVKAA